MILFRGYGFFREHLAHALDLGAYVLQFLFNALVAAIDVVNAVDVGGVVRDEAGEDEAGAGAEIGSGDGRDAPGAQPAAAAVRAQQRGRGIARAAGAQRLISCWRSSRRRI